MSVAVQPRPILYRLGMLRNVPGYTIRWLLLALIAAPGTLHAFENLNQAQNLIYDTAHLSNTHAGQQINYRYRNRAAPDEDVDDRVILSIKKAHEGDKRDVVLDFLSAERHMAFPDFPGFKGNPVIIAMLEHIAQSFGRATGGGVLYFRNRIRDALARDTTRVDSVSAAYQNQAIGATRISFSPFTGDAYLADRPEYTAAVFSIVLSDEVPGGVVSVAVESRQKDATYFEREITIE